jgi:hypothetical protein
VIDIELHIVGIEAAVVIGGWEMVDRVGDVSQVLGAEWLPRSDGELLLLSAELVDDDDMDLFEMLHEGVEIVDVETAARVVATQFVLAVKGGEGVEDVSAVALDGGGELGALEVAGVEGPQELAGGAAGVEAAAE